VEPDFKMNDQFIIENLQYVFGIDALETSRPINIDVNTPAEINSMFDAISYEKGLANTNKLVLHQIARFKKK
jgi:aminopeptidase N